eukprot:6682-Chlamydomonas_euryale.AAC.4
MLSMWQSWLSGTPEPPSACRGASLARTLHGCGHRHAVLSRHRQEHARMHAHTHAHAHTRTHAHTPSVEHRVTLRLKIDQHPAKWHDTASYTQLTAHESRHPNAPLASTGSANVSNPTQRAGLETGLEQSQASDVRHTCGLSAGMAVVAMYVPRMRGSWGVHMGAQP